MLSFKNKFCLFIALIFAPLLIGLLLPTTPMMNLTLIVGGNKLKDSLLLNQKSPRLILVGGSNVSFGFDSQMIHDSLHVNPINTGIQASIGIVFMLNNVLNYVKKGDIVVLIPEYQQFYGNCAYGNESDGMIRSIFDNDITKLKLLKLNQWFFVFDRLPKYAFSKYNINEYENTLPSKIYNSKAFNKYGDVTIHLKMNGRRNITPFHSTDNSINVTVIDEIVKFSEEFTNIGVKFYISFPCIQKKSFKLMGSNIYEVFWKLQKENLVLIGKPHNYIFSDSLLFDTPYHLNRQGIRIRTKRFLRDIRTYIP